MGAQAGPYQKAGFTLVRRKNHPILRCPCGHAQITVAGSSNGGRGHKNAMAQLARTLRECAALKEIA